MFDEPVSVLYAYLWRTEGYNSVLVAVDILPGADPLLPNTTYTVTLAGATDFAGNAIPAVSSTFTTGAGPDLERPSVVSRSPTGGDAPRNSAVTLHFDEAVDPVTVHPDALLPAVTTPTAFSQIISSADGRTVTLLPNEPFPEGARVGLHQGVARDISGNPAFGGTTTLYFGSEIDTTPPQVRMTLPQDGASDFPINAKIVVLLDSEIRAGSLDPAKIRVEKGGVAIPIRMEIVDYGRALELSAVGLFDPWTTYSWSVEGLEDLAGNPLAGIVQGTFATGAAAISTPPAIVSASPAQGATGVRLDAPWVVTFDSPVSPVDLVAAGYPSAAEPSTWTLSPDGRTLTVLRPEPWPPGVTIQLRLDYWGLNGVRGSTYLSATTEE